MEVHQYACLCLNPKAIHKLAIKWIARYLWITWDKGLILHPKSTLSLDMYVDADFTGRWHKDYAKLHDSALSRLAYIIMFFDVLSLGVTNCRAKLLCPWQKVNILTFQYNMAPKWIMYMCKRQQCLHFISYYRDSFQITHKTYITQIPSFPRSNTKWCSWDSKN